MRFYAYCSIMSYYTQIDKITYFDFVIWYNLAKNLIYFFYYLV